MDLRGLLVLALFLATPAEAAFREVTRTPCLPKATAAEEARQVMLKLTGTQYPPADKRISDFIRESNRPRLMIELGELMRERGCGFKKGTQAETLGELQNALARRWFTYKSDFAVPPSIGEGLVMILGTPDSKNLIRIDTTELGFRFRECISHDDQLAIASESCPALGNPTVFVPVEDLLKRTYGIKREFLLVARAVAGAGIVASASLAGALPAKAGVALSLADAANEVTALSPLETYKLDRDTIRVVKDLVWITEQDAAGLRRRVVTRLVTYSDFDTLRSSIMRIIKDTLTDEWKRLRDLGDLGRAGSLAQAQQYAFRDAVYARMEAGQQADALPAAIQAIEKDIEAASRQIRDPK